MRQDDDTRRRIVAVLEAIGIYALTFLIYIGIPVAVFFALLRFSK